MSGHGVLLSMREFGVTVINFVGILYPQHFVANELILGLFFLDLDHYQLPYYLDVLLIPVFRDALDRPLTSSRQTFRAAFCASAQPRSHRLTLGN